MAVLTGPQIGKIANAICEAYTRDSFSNFLLTRLDKRIDRLAGNESLDTVAIQVVQKASMEGWGIELLRALRESRPHMVEIFSVAVDQKLVSLPLDAENLERQIRDKPELDYPDIVARIARLQYQICKIAYQVPEGTVTGTGFLVGPKAVLTNRHVVARVIGEECLPSQVKLTFDYYRPETGLSANIGTECALAIDGWLIDDSPHHKTDTDADAKPDVERPEDCLDYALLQLQDDIGLQSVRKAEDGGEPRGWIYASADHAVPKISDVVFVFQHPEGEPLKWAQPDTVVGINSNQTRVRYRVNTSPGSSGAPVFNASFELIALHHAGDPNFSATYKPEYNQGVPIAKIVKLLHARGYTSFLGDASEGRL